MIVSRPPRVRLLAVAAVVLALEAAGCCPDPGERTDEFEGTVNGDALAHVRDNSGNDDQRCDSACRNLVDGEVENVDACEAVGPEDNPDDPWDPTNVEVSITCTVTYTPWVFCTGRRPQGHVEADVAVDSRAAWFAVHAHLERASVTAFSELADWLQRRRAPFPLVARCCEAAVDEVRHAEALEALARRDGAEVVPPRADPPTDDLFAVALHNAVEGCVSEAFAAVVAAHQAAHARSLELRALFSRIAADELRHGQLAWDLHAWLWDQLTPEQRGALARAQTRALADLAASSRRAAAATPRELGWPEPDHAVRMAELFARRLGADAGLAA
ncbi:ferritin-like domain-containing protein [Nannocystis pusilla]|uniref:Ferritin-like domain-containing protein n=1 Tax=Nannocystis pusilla TaxID=889268 RepID=A0ABS7TXM6_9BACT|nr:ferritin-like domain-containing protein [Nannocystis pusilla]MBZ5713023.1 ferritin-like domain-containing protein [Nannocystis pusilla]